MRLTVIIGLCALLTGCLSGLTQVAGTGAIYHTRCSADMMVTDGLYRTRCEPEPCAPGFTDSAVSHVVVALDPGRKVVGYAERVCIQDLSRASGRFNPAIFDGDAADGASSEKN